MAAPIQDYFEKPPLSLQLPCLSAQEVEGFRGLGFGVSGLGFKVQFDIVRAPQASFGSFFSSMRTAEKQDCCASPGLPIQSAMVWNWFKV